MANRLMRAWFTRAAVAAAVFALPALGAGAANAAVAGAPHEVTSNRPDLVSATILAAVPRSVDFCFDKTLQSTSGSDEFALGGYRSANQTFDDGYALETSLAPPAGLPADSCIRAHFPTDAGDLSQYTIGTVTADVVHTNGGPPTADENNITDSTPLTGSNTHNGTSGFTAGPDLASVIPDSTTNSISFFFDQEQGGSTVAADFYFVDGAGNVCTGSAPIAGGTFGDNFVTVSFTSDSCENGAGDAVPAESVSNAVKAGDIQGAVFAANDSSSALNVDNALPVTGTGTSASADLTDVKMESDQSAMDFTFNKTVTPTDAADFFADLSNGTEVSGNNASVIATSTSATTVRVTFPNFGTYDEYVIGGSVAGRVPDEDGCAVFISALSNGCNTPGSQPLDAPFGNIGAFATGFTTGPDALGAIGNSTTNVVTIALDQRAFFGPAVNSGEINILDGTGNIVATAGDTSVTLPSQGAGAQSITVQFASGQVGSAQNVNLTSDALTTNLGTGTSGSCTGNDCTDQGNVDQILAMTKTSSLVKAALHAKPANKAAEARVTKARRAAAQRKLAKLVAKHHKHHKHHRRHRAHRR